MSDHLGRIFGILAALAVLWILVYWWWEPRPRITFDNGPSVETVSAPGPREPVPEAAPRPRDLRTEPRPDPRADLQARHEPPVAVIPPRFRGYTVKKDDTLERIAKAELGSARYAAAIREANALSDLERLKPGRSIRIPLDPTNVQGKPVAAPVEHAAPAAPAAAEEYTIKSGDTLEKIARARYGSIRFKDLIFEANRDRIKDPDRLRAGDKLRLPAKPD
jgi:nucleoid-associated protein YgaU